MSPMSQVQSVINSAVLDINETLPPERKISLEPDEPLYGPSGVVDSLTLTLLIVSLEQKIEQTFQKSIPLMNAAMAADNNPFQTLGKLSEYIDTSLA